MRKILITDMKYPDFALLLLRVGLGAAFMILHGWGKISNPQAWERLGSNMSNLGITFLPAFWGFMAAFTEFFGAAFLLLGLFTRPAAALLSFTMLVAMLKHLMAAEKYSYPLELMVVFSAIMFLGAGRYSLDHYLFSNNK